MAGFNAGAVYGEIILRYDKAVKALTAVEQQTKKTMGRMTGFVKKHQEAIGAAGRSMLMMSAGMAAGLGLAVRRAAAFEREMRNANAIMKLSAEQFQSITAEVQELSTVLPQSAEVLAQGLYQLASGGIAAADSMDVLEAAATAAVAGVSDTRTAASALITVLNTYELSGKEATRVSDVLFKTVEKGVLTFAELAASLGMAVSSARPAGISLEEVGAAMVVMTRSGFDAAMSATALGRIMETFLSPSKEFEKAIKRITGETTQAIIQERGLIGAIEAMSKAAAGNQAVLAELGLEKRALRAAFALTRGEGKLFTEMLKEHRNAVGATTDAYEEQAKAFAVQWELFKSTVNELLITMGQELLPIMQKYIDRIGDIVESMSEWAKQNRDAAPALAKIATNLTLVVGGVGAAALAIKGLASVFSGPVGIIALIVAATAAIITNREEIEKWIKAKQRALDTTDAWWSSFEDILRSGDLPRMTAELNRLVAAEEAMAKAGHIPMRQRQIMIEQLRAAIVELEGVADAMDDVTDATTDGPTDAVEEFTNRLEDLFERIQKLKQELAELPEGTIAYTHALLEVSHLQERYNFQLSQLADLAPRVAAGLREIKAALPTEEEMAAIHPVISPERFVAPMMGPMESIDQMSQRLAALREEFRTASLERRGYILLEMQALEEAVGRTVEAVSEIDQIWSHAMRRIQDGFANTISRLIETGAGLADWWKGLGDMFRRVWAELLASLVTMWIRDFINRIAVSWMGGALFPTGAAAAGPAIGTTPYQHGGVVTKPTVALVGEAGPERIEPLTGPMSMQTAGGPTINMTVHAIDAESFTDALQRNRKAVANAIFSALEENSPVGRRGAR